MEVAPDPPTANPPEPAAGVGSPAAREDGTPPTWTGGPAHESGTPPTRPGGPAHESGTPRSPAIEVEKSPRGEAGVHSRPPREEAAGAHTNHPIPETTGISLFRVRDTDTHTHDSPIASHTHSYIQ